MLLSAEFYDGVPRRALPRLKESVMTDRDPVIYRKQVFEVGSERKELSESARVGRHIDVMETF